MMLIPYLILNPYFWLIAMALIPAIVLLVFVYKKDRVEHESPKLLVTLLLFGVLAALPATIAESLGYSLLSAVMQALNSDAAMLFLFLYYFFVVALSEEGFKYLLMKKRTWRNPEFNCSFDGVIYAVFVSLGFAAIENVLYVVQYGFAAALLRAVTAVPGHACFAVFMGIWYSRAKVYEVNYAPEESRKCRRRALWLPVLLHGAYDFCASLENGLFSIAFLVLVVLMFIFAFRAVKKASREDRYLTTPETDTEIL